MTDNGVAASRGMKSDSTGDRSSSGQSSTAAAAGLEDLAAQWGDLLISKGVEEEIFEFPDAPHEEGEDSEVDPNLCLIGTLWSIRGGGPKLIEKAMRAAWKLLKPMKMEIVGENLLAFRFASRMDYNKVLREGPWRFDDFLLAFKEWEAGLLPGRADLSTVPFWIQVMGLPAGWRTDHSVRYLGSLMGKVMDSDPTVRRQEGSEELFLRVRVELSILQATPRGTVLRKGKIQFPLSFKYEHLRIFCFFCVFVDHTVLDCERMINEGKSLKDCRYGLWLRGVPPRGLNPGMMGGIGVAARGKGNPFCRPPPASKGLASVGSSMLGLKLLGIKDK